MSGLTPLERGNLIHKLFERFYQTWQQDGFGAITAATLPEALGRFTRLTNDALAGLPEADRALEETRLLGSIVARGIAERVFELEVDEGGEIVGRLLEYDLRGPFPFPILGGMAQKTIAIRGKADRIDVFHDGGLRIIDYKLSRLPDIKTSQQIAVYAHCAAIALEARDGHPYTVNSADYLAFGEEEKSRVGFNSRKGPPGPFQRSGGRIRRDGPAHRGRVSGEAIRTGPCTLVPVPACAARSIELRRRTCSRACLISCGSDEAGRTAARSGGARLAIDPDHHVVLGLQPGRGRRASCRSLRAFDRRAWTRACPGRHSRARPRRDARPRAVELNPAPA
jgi:hypothetical protein